MAKWAANRRRISCPRACSLIKATPLVEDTRCNFRSSPQESHDFRSLRRRRFRKLATAPPVRFAGNTGEPDAPGRGKSQRGTLHRQFRCGFLGGGPESVTQSRCAVHFVRAQYTRPGSPTTRAPYQSLRNLRDRGPGCGSVKMEIEGWRVRSPS